MTDTQVRVRLTADSRQYQQEMGKAAQATSKVETASAGMSAGIAKQAASWAAAGVSAGVAFQQLRSAIDSATQMQDSIAKVGVIFGESAKDVEAFANDSTQAFGLTKTAALDAASTFAVFGKSAGLAGRDLVQFSEELTQRAVDLKSFYGGTVEDAITAVGAALRGEMEPIRRYGVLLDDATLRQRALEMGLVSTTKNALTPQTRALAASAEVLRQTSDAAGDYVRNQDGAANSVQDFTVAIGRLKETLGTELLPTFTLGTQAATTFVEQFSALPDSFKLLGSVVGAPIAAMTAYNNKVLDLIGVGGDAADTVGRLGTAGQQAAAGIDIFGTRARAAAGDVGNLAEATADAIAQMNGLIDSQQAAMSARRDLLGAQDRIRAGMTNTATAAAGSAKAQTAAAKETDKATARAIEAIRKQSAEEQKAEIERARRRAQRKADERADAQARRAVKESVAEAIATDKAARRGEDIDGNNQTGTVGEATGRLTKADTKALDARIAAIRAKHKKAADAQIKAIQDSAKASKSAATAATSAGGSYEYFSTSLSRNTVEGRKNLDVLDGEVDAIQRVGQSVYDASIEAGDGAEIAGRKALRAMQNARAELIDTYGQLGFNIDRVKDYLDRLEATNKTFTSTLKLKVEDTASNKALAEQRAKIMANKALAAELRQALPSGTPTAPLKDKKVYGPSSYPYTPSRFAGGGEIGGSGGTTADTVPIWASRGEFVVNASQFAANRELVRAINSGTGKVAAGMTIGQINVTESGTRVRASVLDALAEQAYRSGAVR